MIDDSIKERFWEKVDKKEEEDECWNWKAGKTNGYGMFYVDRYNPVLAHRMSWILANGSIPHGKLVLHKCDNKLCVNPIHLYCGTHCDNMLDAIERSPTGATSRFDRKDVDYMRELYSEGFPYGYIAHRYKCSKSHVGQLIRGKVGCLRIPFKRTIKC